MAEPLKSSYASDSVPTVFYGGPSTVTTTLSADLASTDTAFAYITDCAGIRPKGVCVIGGVEIVLYESAGPSVILDLTRGHAGTSATSHSSGAAVTFYVEQSFQFTDNAIKETLNDMQSTLGIVMTNCQALNKGKALMPYDDGQCDWQYIERPEIVSGTVTLTAQDRGKVLYNSGGSTADVTLPSAATDGDKFTFIVATAHTMTVIPAPNWTIRIGANESGDGRLEGSGISSDLTGAAVTLFAVQSGLGGVWFATSVVREADWTVT